MKLDWKRIFSWSALILFITFLFEFGIGFTAHSVMDKQVFADSFFNKGLSIILVWNVIAIFLLLIGLFISHEIER